MKKKLQQYDPYPTSISALDFNANGTLLAIASSYTFDEGEKDHPPDSIIIKQVSDQDITAKPKF